MQAIQYETDLDKIASLALEREGENYQFQYFLKPFAGADLDAIVHQINDEASAAIDCTKCGNCCKSLVINIAESEVKPLAELLAISVEDLKEKYVEESMAGKFFINTIPCHFLSENKCTIYENRFEECRQFPHLHKPGFKERFLGTLLHYGRCPIIYNVVETLKNKLQFDTAL